MAIKASVSTSPVIKSRVDQQNAARALANVSTTVKARVGQQNVSRVLSSTSSAKNALIIDSADVDDSRRSEDGLILVWDSSDEKFVLTNRVDALSIEFANASRSSFLNVTNDLSVGRNLSVTGVSTFLDNINVVGDFLSSLIPTETDTYNVGSSTKKWKDGHFAGIITAGNLSSSDTLVVEGGTTLNTLLTQGQATLNTLTVEGATTLVGNVQITTGQLTGNLRVTGELTVDDGLKYLGSNFNGPNGIGFFNDSGVLKSSKDTTEYIQTSSYILTTQVIAGTETPVWTNTIDGGEY